MYLDTGIIVKLLVQEPDSGFFSRELTGKVLVTSELAWTEVHSALLSKERANQIAPMDRERAWNAFCGWLESKQIHVHPLNSIALKKANQILGVCHPSVALRTLDAIHVAACDLSQDFPICTTDKRMREAAQMLGIPIFPKTLSDLTN